MGKGVGTGKLGKGLACSRTGTSSFGAETSLAPPWPGAAASTWANKKPPGQPHLLLADVLAAMPLLISWLTCKKAY